LNVFNYVKRGKHIHRFVSERQRSTTAFANAGFAEACAKQFERFFKIIHRYDVAFPDHLCDKDTRARTTIREQVAGLELMKTANPMTDDFAFPGIEPVSGLNLC
jgi:hypothetical protein